MRDGYLAVSGQDGSGTNTIFVYQHNAATDTRNEIYHLQCTDPSMQLSYFQQYV